MSAPLQGRTALVTGAGRGIGRALAEGLAEQGASLVLVARSADQLAATAESIGPDAVVTVPADLGRRAGIDAVLAAIEREREVDVLVNNAATVAPLGPSVTLDPDAYAASFDLNVLAVARLTFGLLPGMVTRGWGRIVNVSSGIVARPGAMIGGNAYVASKAALEAHTVNVAAELAGTGVTANVYRPGVVDTAMQSWIRGQDPERVGTGLHERFVEYERTGVLITPEASAAAVLPRLVGDATGQIWDVSDEVS